MKSKMMKTTKTITQEKKDTFTWYLDSLMWLGLWVDNEKDYRTLTTKIDDLRKLVNKLEVKNDG